MGEWKTPDANCLRAAKRAPAGAEASHLVRRPRSVGQREAHAQRYR